MDSWGSFDIKMSSYQKNSYYKEKTVSEQSYLHTGESLYLENGLLIESGPSFWYPKSTISHYYYSQILTKQHIF